MSIVPSRWRIKRGIVETTGFDPADQVWDSVHCPFSMLNPHRAEHDTCHAKYCPFLQIEKKQNKFYVTFKCGHQDVEYELESIEWQT